MRTLTLKKDTLGELAPDELALVGGGQADTSIVPSYAQCPVSGAYPTIPVVYCLKK
ncbi:MAG TPA: hypothetical protein VFQ85_13615 [Mycobacteriales bacterium]|jgi:hypothetical protein|nr:hypothetical protein [Mycobacteriales bacterium]